MKCLKPTTSLRKLSWLAMMVSAAATHAGAALVDLGGDESGDPSGGSSLAAATIRAQNFIFDATFGSPQLTISNNQGSLAITWPADAADWVLEQSPYLQPPIPWSRVPPALYQLNLTNLALTLPPQRAICSFACIEWTLSLPLCPG